MRKNWEYRRGDIYLANLDPVVGAEIGGIRPVLILQNNTGNFFSPTLIAAPLTSNVDKKPNQPTHFLLEQVRGLNRPSMVILEQLKTHSPALFPARRSMDLSGAGARAVDTGLS